MPWIVYETKNLVTGDLYIGVCKTTRFNFHLYLGSGSVLRSAVRKYGRDNFERTTLIEVETAKEAYLIEAAIVDEEWVARQDTYNLKTGGLGGMGFSFPMPEAAKEKIRQYRLGRKHTEETKSKIRDSVKGRVRTEEERRKCSEAATRSNTGRVLSEETKRLLAERQRAAWARGRKSRKGNAT